MEARARSRDGGTGGAVERSIQSDEEHREQDDDQRSDRDHDGHLTPCVHRDSPPSASRRVRTCGHGIAQEKERRY